MTYCSTTLQVRANDKKVYTVYGTTIFVVVGLAERTDPSNKMATALSCRVFLYRTRVSQSQKEEKTAKKRKKRGVTPLTH